MLWTLYIYALQQWQHVIRMTSVSALSGSHDVDVIKFVKDRRAWCVYGAYNITPKTRQFLKTINAIEGGQLV